MKKLLLFIFVVFALSLVFTSCFTETEVTTTTQATSTNPPVDMHVHSFGEWELVKEVTATDEGLEIRYCECGEKEEKYIHSGSEGLEYNLVFGSYSVTNGKFCMDAEVIIPNTYNGIAVTSIGSEAFRGNKFIQNVIIPDSVTYIDNMAFYSCDSLESVTFSNSLKIIGDDAFAHCALLSNIELPDSLTTIGCSAFASCQSFTSLTIPKSVKKIGDSLLLGCAKLENIYVDQGNEHYKDIDGVLYSQDGTVLVKYPEGRSVSDFTIPTGVTTIYKEAFVNVDFVDFLDIPEGITHIGDSAFATNAVHTIYIPASVVSIGDGAFNSCWMLTNLNVDPNNEHYQSIDGNLYTKDGKTIIKYANGKEDTSFVIPDSVSCIAEYAFYNCESLESIVISDYVTTIDKGAFMGCRALTSIELPNSLTTIGDSAFAYCESLTNVVIPDSVRTIGTYAFGWCESLQSITISSSIYRIDSYPFSNCYSLESIYFNGTVKEWDSILKDYYSWTNNNLNYTIYCTNGTISNKGEITYEYD